MEKISEHMKPIYVYVNNIISSKSVFNVQLMVLRGCNIVISSGATFCYIFITNLYLAITRFIKINTQPQATTTNELTSEL